MPRVSLAQKWGDRLRLPAIAAPMLHVSGPELVAATCSVGVIGSFPTANARTAVELDQWLTHLKSEIAPEAAPFAANLIMRSPRFTEDLKLLAQHEVEVVITSVGSPEAAIEVLHDVGAVVMSDVATLRHARQAVDAGADGLVLLTAGAGGQTGWLNPFAFVRAVRAFYEGPIVLAGGISDGRSLAASETLGCDFGYMGTTFLATEESRAAAEYKQMLVDSSLDDVILTRAFTGLSANMLEASIRAAGLDPAHLDETVTVDSAAAMYGSGGHGPARWTQVWSAGHSVSGVRSVEPVAAVIERLVTEYRVAVRERT
ncbi:NAD(P)H-dependent flavin oxidoreductase [Gordonia terrae]|uniref:NAD(P)H-dependent flavin oxidoreductase n=1 Tax=Gordonia terrae TaxID=2055 RepID=UPI003F6D38BA